jgi:ribosomal-protein-alanine N-acetyltransferase
MATRPERRGEGLALRLLDAFILQARQAAVEHIWLEVRLGNVAAHRLYQRRGFVVEGRRPRYYDDGEDALVMALRLSR